MAQIFYEFKLPSGNKVGVAEQEVDHEDLLVNHAAIMSGRNIDNFLLALLPNVKEEEYMQWSTLDKYALYIKNRIEIYGDMVIHTHKFHDDKGDLVAEKEFEIPLQPILDAIMNIEYSEAHQTELLYTTKSGKSLKISPITIATERKLFNKPDATQLETMVARGTRIMIPNEQSHTENDIELANWATVQTPSLLKQHLKPRDMSELRKKLNEFDRPATQVMVESELELRAPYQTPKGEDKIAINKISLFSLPAFFLPTE